MVIIFPITASIIVAVIGSMWLGFELGLFFKLFMTAALGFMVIVLFRAFFES